MIDDNPDVREALEEMEVLHIEGRGSDDEVLLEAGIERARAVIACIDSDAENIFATLTARELRPDIQIVARAAEEASERKLIARGRERRHLSIQDERQRDGPARARRRPATAPSRRTTAPAERRAGDVHGAERVELAPQSSRRGSGPLERLRDAVSEAAAVAARRRARAADPDARAPAAGGVRRLLDATSRCCSRRR